MRVRTVLPALAAALVTVGLAALYASGHHDGYAALVSIWGFGPYEFPFLDTHGVVAAVYCHRLGYDVFVTNPCDVLARVFNYSPLWLELSRLPIEMSWTPAAGIVIDATFLLSLLLLPPARRPWQVAAMTLATLSSSVAFGLERGNIDLIMFVLSILVIRLAARPGWPRFAAYALALFAGMLKFYPVVLLVTIVRERLATAIIAGVLSALAIGIFIAVYFQGLVEVLPTIPSTSCFARGVFAARDLPCGIAQVLPGAAGTAVALFGLLAAMVVLVAVMVTWRSDLAARLVELNAVEATAMLVGCTLILACFFSAQNVAYRGVYLLFVLPGLMALASGGAGGIRRMLTLAAVLILSLMDWDALWQCIDYYFRASGANESQLRLVDFDVWLVHEIAWWFVAAVLASLLLCLLSRSRAWCDLCATLRFFWPRGRIHAQEQRMRHLAIFLVPMLCVTVIAHAAPPSDPSLYCETAIVGAEQALHLPPRLLGAIANVESGRPDASGRLHPWPWTIDAEGRGQFFATKAEAIAAVRALQASGVRSIDVGCMQVNLMHHPNAFASLDEAFDPGANAQYAARFLNTLYGASGSWLIAIAAYHSETPAIGADYQQRVVARWRMPGAPAVAAAYGMFAPARAAYADFEPRSQIYGDFASSPPALSPRLARR